MLPLDVQANGFDFAGIDRLHDECAIGALALGCVACQCQDRGMRRYHWIVFPEGVAPVA